jgi:phosphocarrier protein
MTMEDPVVAKRQVEMINSLGLTLRGANKFAKLAIQFQSEIWVDYMGTKGNAKSILDLTTLAMECGASFEISALGPDSEAAVTSLAHLVEARFYEYDDWQY